MKFRRTSAEVEAYKFDGKNAEELILWVQRSVYNTKNKPEITYNGRYSKILNQRQGNAPDLMIGKGEWIVRNSKDTFFSCSERQFLQNYEPVPPKDQTLSG